MSQLSTKLIMAMEKQLEIYREVLDIAKKKRQVIIDNEIKTLETLTVKEQGLTLSLLKLEDIRQKIIDALLKEKGIGEVKDLSELMLYLAPGEQHRAEGLRRELMDLLGELKSHNDLNGQLIRQSLEFIDFNMNMMKSFKTPDAATYRKDLAEDREDEIRSLFDAKV
jgi:hypothetical protein